MTVSRNSWVALAGGYPSGTITIPAGTNRCLLVKYIGEAQDANAAVILANYAFTIDSVAPDQEGFQVLDHGADAQLTYYAAFNEASIQSFTTNTLSFTDGPASPPNKNAWSYATFADVDQTTMIVADYASDDGSGGAFSDFLSGSLTASAGDYATAFGSCAAATRSFTYSANWTELWDQADPDIGGCRAFACDYSEIPAGGFTLTATKNASDTNAVAMYTLLVKAAAAGGAATITQWAGTLDRFRRC